jgi:hypothetical protein
MNIMSHLIHAVLLLGLVVACGKDNKSGQSNEYAYNNGYSGYNAYGQPNFTGYSNISSPYSYGGYSVNTILNENPCMNYQSVGRIQIQVSLTSFPSVISSGDTYVGVTSYGDVGVIVGTGAAPLFVGYICPRTVSSGNGQLTGISLGAYTQCAFKPLVAANMIFPDGTAANFRMLDYGSSRGAKFSVCR